MGTFLAVGFRRQLRGKALVFSLQRRGDHYPPALSAAHSAPRTRARRVAFLVSHYSAGGAQEVLTNIAEGTQARGFEIHLVALYPLAHASSASPSKLPWRRTLEAKPSNPLVFFALLRDLARKLRAAQPDAVISALPAANIAAVVAGRLTAPQAKVIITHPSPIGTHNRLFNAVDGWPGRWSNVTAAGSVSNTVTNSLETKAADYRAKRRTIHNALPPDIGRLLQDLASAGARRSGQPRNQIATGRLSAQKNCPALLRAASRLFDVRFVVIGGGEDEAQLKALARELGVDERVEFLERQAREDALRTLSESGVLAQPSLCEGHSLALIEAAKANIPIIVSNVPEQIEGVTADEGQVCAALVEPHDDEALAREIQRLHDDRAAYAASETRARHLADAFRCERMVASYEELVA